MTALPITPGPWRQAAARLAVNIMAGQGLILAKIPAYGNYSANAKAIAAVPAMIEALVAVRPYLEVMKRQGEDRVWRPADRNLSTIDAALKLAGVEP